MPAATYACQDYDNHRIRKIDLKSGETTTLAGSSKGFNDGVGTSAQFSKPMGIAIDPKGDFALVSVRACPHPRVARASASPTPAPHPSEVRDHTVLAKRARRAPVYVMSGRR